MGIASIRLPFYFPKTSFLSASAARLFMNQDQLLFRPRESSPLTLRFPGILIGNCLQARIPVSVPPKGIISVDFAFPRNPDYELPL
jgi:hypothetical protein